MPSNAATARLYNFTFIVKRKNVRTEKNERLVFPSVMYNMWRKFTKIRTKNNNNKTLRYFRNWNQSNPNNKPHSSTNNSYAYTATKTKRQANLSIPFQYLINSVTTEITSHSVSFSGYLVFTAISHRYNWDI